MTHPMPLPLRRWFWLQALLVLLTLMVCLPSRADLNDSRDRYDRDPPTRVARVAEVQGPAFWYDPEQRNWQPLTRNQTLADGDRVRVDDNGRLGLRIGGHSLWLNERSQLELRRLDESRIDLDLEQGSLALRWLTREAAQDAMVRTREGRFMFERAGAYRIDQLQRASRGQAYEGRLRFDHRGEERAPLYLEVSEQAELWWDGGPRAERSRLLRADAFGDWLSASLGFGRNETASWRDRPAYRYVSPEMTGADELDNYGRWESSSEFGPLWYPARVAVDWAPFRNGRWGWTVHWGWTWVDEQPWGYATSHYGRWVNWRGRWCWAPGAVVVNRPVFAPALVTWVGSGNVQVGITIGGRYAPPVAWYPLAPYESYRPWYRHGPTYVQRIDPDPHLVRRPVEGWAGSNRAVPGAVSTFGRVAGGVADQAVLRPVPLRGDVAELRQLNPLPQGPTRQLVRDVAATPNLPLVQGPARGADPLPVPMSIPAARVNEDEGPRVRAGGGSGRGRELPTREAMPQGQPQVMPQAMPQVQPQVQVPAPEPRREMPWRQDVPRTTEAQQRTPADEPSRWDRGDRQERVRREREGGDERPAMPMRQPRQEMPAPQRMEVPQAMPQVQMPQRQQEPMRRIELPRAEPQRAEPQRAEPPRRGRDDDAGPRRGQIQ